MTNDNLEAAITEAQRFLQRAKELRQERRDEPYYSLVGTRASGACRRASMDLTRALADLRKPA